MENKHLVILFNNSELYTSITKLNPMRFGIKKIKVKNRHVELTLPIVKLKAL